MAVDVDGVEIDLPVLSPQNEKAESQRITEWIDGFTMQKLQVLILMFDFQ